MKCVEIEIHAVDAIEIYVGGSKRFLRTANKALSRLH